MNVINLNDTFEGSTGRKGAKLKFSDLGGG